MVSLSDKYSSNLMRWITRFRARTFVGLSLITLFCIQFQLGAGIVVPEVLRESVVMAGVTANTPLFESLIRRDPLGALIEARTEHVRIVVDYECVMVKQELLPSGMSKEQEIKVKFRHSPYSVYMEWVRNPGMAVRVLYVKGRWRDLKATNPDERELAIAQPGVIARLFIKSVKEPIHGRLAKKASRRFLDDFGFQKTLDRLIKVSEQAKSRGELTLKYCGESQFDGRPVWVIRRHLPYTAEGGLYPDRTAEILVDKALRVAVAVYCYSDVERHPSNLLAKYEYRSIRMGAGLTNRDFEPTTYGM
ncbi:MAG: DUF1571 domain-containing protein [Planctomycetia bacterium]|nr:DUF1571 domain-containing protein [Planctomycetia bacterium]